MKGPNSTSQFRRAQIVSLSLTEIMLLLVFMAVTFSFLAKEESEKKGPDVRGALNNALAERDTLRRDVASLEDKLATAAPEAERLTSFLKASAIDPATLKPRN